MHHLSQWMSLWTASLAITIGGLASVGCDALDCGPGTIEKNGSCAPADDDPSAAQCGAGTVLGPSGKCEAEEVVVCDPDTTVEQEDPATHVITCVGTGETGCNSPIACPAPSAGRITICGRLYDTQTGAPIEDAGATGAVCPGTPTADGPCSLKMQFFDAVEFAGNPTGATPQTPAGGLTIDTCGRFRASDLPEASLGFMGVAVDDANGTADRHKLTGVALANGDALPARNVSAYATRNETDTTWTSGAALAGQSFATRGALLMVFRHRGEGVADVTARRGNQAVPNDDYYFTDASTLTRNNVDTATGRNKTGMNGAVLVLDATHAVSSYDGVGGEPATCQWPSNLAAAVLGVVFVQHKDAVQGGALCP